MRKIKVAMQPTLNAFVQRIAELIDATEKTQRQIAEEMGYDMPNIITMFKQGTTRIPLNKVPAFAFSVETDAAHLVRLWLLIYEPEALSVIDAAIKPAVSDNEASWLQALRRAFEGQVPAFSNLAGSRMPPT